MKILVTGGAGYIGSHISNQLSSRGHEVVVFDDFSTGFKESLSEEIQIVKGDIRSLPAVESALKEHKIEAVIHCAAKISVEESIQNPNLYYDVNAAGTRTLLYGCLKHRIKNFIFSSTAAVYGEVSDSPVGENYHCSPINPYGTSKYRAEKSLEDIQKSGTDFNFIILRYFNVVGAAAGGKNGQRYSSPALFPMASSAALRIIPGITVNGLDYPTKDGSCIRDYIHIDDLVEAHILSLEYVHREKRSEILNCGYGTGYSVLEVLKKMQEVSGNNFEIHIGSRRPHDPTNVVADNRLIRSKLGWEPRYNDLTYMCKSTYEWQKRLNGL